MGLSIYVVTCSFFISRDVEHVDFKTVEDLKDPLIAKVGRITLDVFGRCCMRNIVECNIRSMDLTFWCNIFQNCLTIYV